MFKDYNHYVGNEMNGVIYGYTKRTNGYSQYKSNAFNMALYIGDDETNVHKHQELLAEEIGFQRKDFVMPVQNHGNKVKEITLCDRGSNIESIGDALNGIDAMYTYDLDVLLGMNYADCTPIYVYSTENTFIGLAHTGWKGTKQQILKKLLSMYQGNIDNLKVIIGVTINGNYYEVDDKVINESFKIHEDAVKSHGNYFYLDLKTANKYQALEFGIKEENIFVTKLGTEQEDFFSFRLDEGPTGRALGFIGRRKQDD